MNSATRRIALETHQRSVDALANGESESAEFIVWWALLASHCVGVVQANVSHRGKLTLIKVVAAKSGNEE